MDVDLSDRGGALLMRALTPIALALALAFSAVLATAPARAFVPYAHEGVCAIPIDGALVQARALFNSEVSSHGQGVTVQVRFPLPGGGDGYLTMDMGLAPIGQKASVTWTYYEKISASIVSFEAQTVDGTVTVLDRFETDAETSLHLEFSVTFTEGEVVRTIDRGFAVTAPSPAVLRTSGELPDGVVVVDDGSATNFVGVGASYDRGSIDCYGHPDDEVIIVEDDDYEYEDYYEGEETFVAGDEESEVSCDGSTDTDDDYYDDESDYDSGDDDSAPVCDGSTDSDTGDDSYDSDSSSDDSSGFDCTGDTEAALGIRALPRVSGPRYLRAALRGSTKGSISQRLAGRIVALSPMLIALVILLGLRGRQPVLPGAESPKPV